MYHDVRYKDRPEEIARFIGDKAVPFEEHPTTASAHHISKGPTVSSQNQSEMSEYEDVLPPGGATPLLLENSPSNSCVKPPETIPLVCSVPKRRLSPPPRQSPKHKHRSPLRKSRSSPRRRVPSEKRRLSPPMRQSPKHKNRSPLRPSRSSPRRRVPSETVLKRTITPPPMQSRTYWSGHAPQSEHHIPKWHGTTGIVSSRSRPSAAVSMPPERRGSATSTTFSQYLATLVPTPFTRPSVMVPERRDVATTSILCTLDNTGRRTVHSGASTHPAQPDKVNMHAEGPASVRCVFRDCQIVKEYSCNANHFFQCHLPTFLRREDGKSKMNLWAKLFLRILRHLELKTIDDLYDRVLTRGWFPANRSAENIEKCGQGISRYDIRLVDAFAEYIGDPKPDSYCETQPRSPAILINWRVLKCIMQHGFSAEDRKCVVYFDKPPIGSNIFIPRRF